MACFVLPECSGQVNKVSIGNISAEAVSGV